jgi:phosphatidate cytidylyltransferase
VTDRFEEERRSATPIEGVRILGAEEAQAAVEGRGRDADESPPAAPHDDAPERPFPDAGPTWSASEVGEAPPTADASPPERSEPTTGEVPPLPHWSEPPTGAVPAIFADDADETGADDLDAWASISGSQPRFRADDSDWDDAAFAADDLASDEPREGALGAPPPDDDEAFAAALAERRRRTPRGRAPREMVTSPPPPSPPAPTPPRPRAPRADEGELAPPGPGAARDLPTALVTAGVVAVIALICFTQGPAWTNVLVAVIVGLGTLELTAALRHRGVRAAAPLALAGAVAMPLAAREYGTAAYPVLFGLVIVFGMLWYLWEITPGRPFLGVSATLLAFGYVGGLGGFAGLLLASPDGVGLVLGVALCAIAYDVFGFFVGSQFGRSQIAPRVSPNKSFEGTLAGMLASVVVGWLIVGGGLVGDGIFPWSPGKAATLGLFVAVGAFFGDLCESMLKRDLQIKDFGSLLPGHGGVLDRFDAILFCLPITWFLALHFNIW